MEEVVGSFGTNHGLFFGAVQFLISQMGGLIEIHDSKIVEAAEDIVMDIILHKLKLRIEGIVPDNLQIVNGQAILFVPVQVLAHQKSVPQVHLKGWNIFVDDCQ